MNYKFILLIIASFFLTACNQYSQKEKAILYVGDQIYQNTGFALIYSNELKKDNKISKKIDNRSLLIFHKTIRKNSFVKITNLTNQKTIIAEVISNDVLFPDLYNSVITNRIADELSLSQTTIQWLSSSNVPMDEENPSDIMVGWRSIAVKAARVEAVSYVFCDIIDEEIGEDIDTMVGISINGIPFAQAIAGQMDLELSVSRSISESEAGHLSEVFANVSGKRVVVIDDVVSSGTTMRKTVQHLRESGAEVKLCLVLANKTEMNEIDGVPLRGLVRVVTV